MPVDHLRLFPTHVWVSDVPGTRTLNAELRERLLAERHAHPGVAISNAGGWHSVPDLSQRAEGCFQAVMQHVIDRVGAAAQLLGDGRDLPPHGYSAMAWAMVMDGGDHAVPHDHIGSHFSAVYYVDAGDADAERFPDSGRLAFLDPRPGRLSVHGVLVEPSTLSVSPAESLLVVFPGWLTHFVHPYRGTRPRISISANVNLVPAPPT